MTQRIERGKCYYCGPGVKLERHGRSVLAQILLTIVTGGLWLPFGIGVMAFGGEWRCTGCGSKRTERSE